MPKKNLILQISNTSSWILIGVLASIVFHYPFIISYFNLFPGDDGDSRFITFILEHIYRWFSNKSTFNSPTFFFPEAGTLGLSDVHLLHALVYSLIRYFDVSMLKSLSLTIFILNTLTYIATFCFIRFGMKLNLFPSIIGALIFSFNSAKLNVINHTQLQPLLLIPLISWFLILAHDECNKKKHRIQVYLYAFFAILFYHLQLLTSVYVTWFYSVILFFGILVLLSTYTARTYLIKFVKNNLIVIIYTSVIFILFSIPFFDIYHSIHKNSVGWGYDGHIVNSLPTLKSYLWMGSENMVWGGISKQENFSFYWTNQGLGIGIGLVFSCFALLSFYWGWKSFLKVQKGKLALHWRGPNTLSKITPIFDTSKYFLLIGILGVSVFFILSLKLDSSLWSIIYSNLPGSRSIREVSRYALIAYFFVGIFVSLVLHQIEHKVYCSKIRAVIFVGLSSLISMFGIVEQIGVGVSFDSIHSEKWVKAVVRKIDPKCGSFYLMAHPNFPRASYAIHTDAMMASHLTNIPTINGYSGNDPKKYSLSNLSNPKAEDIKNSIKDWKASMNIGGNICIINHEIIN